ncbi:Actin family protein [Tritrichomonas foetus]|uniref:Actin family protein n=1 Tax=Tritrichomonas foetus TaxID=1144522 RepID=A0A1J4KN17_9EUKA|nr:Actin family protein [Tritrichomonas foetus]|eukprot:OHT12627.1 Actin family protein [Tritrichomonas foetus]
MMNVVNNTHNVLVYDFGTSAIKFGYGGDIKPLFSIPPYSAQRNQDDELHIQFGEEWLQKDLPGVEVMNMVNQDGTIKDREMIMPFFDWTYDTCFGELDPQEWKVLFSQPSSLLKQPAHLSSRRKLFAELAFEFGNHTQISYQHDASLACYAHGIHTGVVIDFGMSCLRVVPVLEGHPLRRAIKIHRLGGFEMTDRLFQAMSTNGKSIRTFLDPKPSDGFGGFFAPQRTIVPSQSQLSFCRRNVLIDMIKNHLKFKLEPDPKETIADYVYFMAGREPVDIQSEIESLSSNFWIDSNEQKSLTTLVAEAIALTPPETQATMWSTIVTCGGLSKLPGFNVVLEHQLNKVKPKNMPTNVVKPICQEASGSFAVWVGGSIVASYANFPDLCISSTEWNEQGERILELKCL